MILAQVQKIIVHRSQLEADVSDWFSSNPAAVLWFMGGGVALVLILYYGQNLFNRKR